MSRAYLQTCVVSAIAITLFAGSSHATELVLSGAALPQDQGWTLHTNLASPNVTTNGTAITLSTTGAGTGAQLMFYKNAGVGGGHFWIEARVKVISGSNSTRSRALFTTYSPATIGGSASENLDMFRFDDGSIGWGDQTELQVNTTSTFHTYRFEQLSTGGPMTVSMDGTLVTTRVGIVSDGVIAIGDPTPYAWNGSFSIESIVIFRDCNGNGIEDPIDLQNGDPDCNGNLRPDSCDLFSGDCDGNLLVDSCEIAGGAADCNLNGVMDACELNGVDCNANQVPDSCDIAGGFSQDADGNDFPDECLLNGAGLLADPSGINKCRFISFVVPNSGDGAITALRIWMISLHNVVPPYAGGPTIPFSLFDRQAVWVGPPGTYMESTANQTPFHAARTQCTPYYQDWNTIGLLHVTGSAIVPSSIYQVQQVAASCEGQENSCSSFSPRLEIKTSRWGDVSTPFNPPSLSVQPDVADIGAVVNKFRSELGAPIKARVVNTPSNPFGEITTTQLTQDVSFSAVASCIDAFRGPGYPASMGKCANSSAPCARHADCGADGPCELYCPN